jgi:hypothetical protein
MHAKALLLFMSDADVPFSLQGMRPLGVNDSHSATNVYAPEAFDSEP